MAAALSIVWLGIIMIRTAGIYWAWNLVLASALDASDISFADALLLGILVGLVRVRIARERVCRCSSEDAPDGA